MSIATIRTSLLLFYRRIFTTRGFQYTTTVIMVINACWLLVFIIVSRWLKIGFVQLINQTGDCPHVLCKPYRTEFYRLSGLADSQWRFRYCSGPYCALLATFRDPKIEHEQWQEMGYRRHVLARCIVSILCKQFSIGLAI